MWVVYSLLALLGLLVLAVLFVPVYARVAYDGELLVKVRVLGIPIRILPASPEKKAEEKPKKPDKPKKSKKKDTPSDKPSKLEEIKALFKQDDLSATVEFLRRLAALASRAAGRMLRAVTVNRLRLEMCIATGDPADTAQRYGQVCGVLYPSLAVLERVIRVRRRQLRVEPNFLLEKGGVAFDVRLQVSVIRVIGAGIAALFGFLLLMIKQTNAEEVA